jgi:hypothetical protein
VRRFVDDGYQLGAPRSWRATRPILDARIAMALLEREVIDAERSPVDLIEGKELPIKVNPNVPPPAKDDDVQQVLKPAPGQPNVAPGERPAQA